MESSFLLWPRGMLQARKTNKSVKNTFTTREHIFPYYNTFNETWYEI